VSLFQESYHLFANIFTGLFLSVVLYDCCVKNSASLREPFDCKFIDVLLTIYHPDVVQVFQPVIHIAFALDVLLSSLDFDQSGVFHTISSK